MITQYAFSMVETDSDKQERANIDTVFKQITELYDEEMYYIILYNLFHFSRNRFFELYSLLHSINAGMTQ